MFRLRAAPAEPIDLCSPKVVPHVTTSPNFPFLQCPNFLISTATVVLDPEDPVTDLPSHPITANHRLAPVEREAFEVCKKDLPPTREDVIRCFDLIPRSYMKLGPQGSRYVVGGASPRSRRTLLTHSTLLPIFNTMVTKYIRSVCPQHKFTTYVLRTGVLDKPHRDTKNAPLPSFIQALRTPNPDLDGLWVQDPMGTTFKVHEGSMLRGTVIPLNEPFIFQPRSVLHAGFVGQSSESLGRLILVAFSTIHASVLSESTQSELKDLGFHIPSAGDFQCALHGSVSGDYPRLRQLTLQEALRTDASVLDRHDVVALSELPISISDDDGDP